MTPFIEVNGQRFDLNQIYKHTAQSRFEDEVVGFIQDWIAGRETFHQNTSGSTGKPKLIEITRSQMMASAMMTIEALHLKPQQNSLLCLSPQYIAGKMMLVRSIINKMNIVVVEPSLNPLEANNAQVDFAAFTPMQFHQILENQASDERVNTIETIILGGGNVSAGLLQKVGSLKANVYSTYGMTETASHIALRKLNGIDRSNFYTCFEGIELNQDSRDCLTIKGPVTNFKKIITNDRVQLINDKQFEWLGRVDHVINSGGIKIQSEKVERKVEQIFSEIPITTRFFIAGLPHPSLGEQVTLFIEGPVSQKLRDKIKTHLSDRFAKYEVPKDVIYIPEFSETPTGKINRKKTIKAINY